MTKRPYKLAFICHEFPPIGGGASTALDILTQNLAAHGHDVLVLTIGPSDEFTGFHHFLHRQVISLGNIRKNPFCPSLLEFLKSYLLLRFKSPRFLNAFNPDCIIAFFAFPSGHALLPYIKKKKIPFVVSIRGVDAPGFHEDRLKGLVQRFIPFLVKPVLELATLVYTNGKHLKELIEKNIPPLKCLINLPNGVSLPANLPEKKIHFKSLNIIFVGQFISRKRIVETLKGVLLFARQTSEKIVFTLVGAGELESSLQSIALEAPSNLLIIFKGYISRSDLFLLYREQHVMMHLSQDEGVSNTFLEGLAHGLAFLSSPNVVYEMENLENFPGKILTSFSPEEIAHNLKDLFSDPKKLYDLFKISSNYAENFSWEKHTQSFLKCMRHVIDE